MRGPATLRHEYDAAQDDQAGADDERDLERLVEHDERQHDGEQRSRTRHDRRPRGADLPDREREQELRRARREQAGDRHDRRALGVDPDAAGERVDGGDREAGQCGHEGTDVGVGDARERHSQHDAHRAEADGGDEGESDDVHGRRRIAA